MKVTAYTSTRGRTLTSLPLCIMSLCHQTRLPDDIWIYDDTDYNTPEFGGKAPDWRDHWLWKHIFSIMQIKGIQWKWNFGAGKGQVLNHQRALMESDADFIWRVDDDNYAEPNVLETLLKYYEQDTQKQIGAIGQNVWHADRGLSPAPSFARNKMTKGIYHQVIEWFVFPDANEREAEHLYSTFLYRREAGLKAGGYPMDLSPVGHHEETIFSHKIFRAGYKLLVTPHCKLWHLRNPDGGIRAYTTEWLWKKDQETQDKYMAEWGYNDKETKFIYATAGIGDAYALRDIINELAEPWKVDHDVVVVYNHPEIWADFDDLQKIANWELTSFMGKPPETADVYAYMHGHPGISLRDAYRGMYRREG